MHDNHLNMSKELVSIVMPMYNSEKFLVEAIESVIAQSYTNWELLITDDCSSDKSFTIAQLGLEPVRQDSLCDLG